MSHEVNTQIIETMFEDLREASETRDFNKLYSLLKIVFETEEGDIFFGTMNDDKEGQELYRKYYNNLKDIDDLQKKLDEEWNMTY